MGSLGHGIYTKGANWLNFTAPITSNWSFKKICCVKDKFKTWISQAHYSIKETYKTHFDDASMVSWDKFFWNTPSVPKGKFVLWMIMLDNLKTKNKLMQIRVLDNDLCPMCLAATAESDNI